MPDFEMVCTHASSQGRLIVEADTLTLGGKLGSLYGTVGHGLRRKERGRIVRASPTILGFR
jgi:hypothetical protein